MIKLVKIRKQSNRVGRGSSGKGGQTAGRGTKGQKSRTGFNIPTFFEGGQSSLIKRLPKAKGFKSVHDKPQVVNLNAINLKYKDGEIVNPKSLYLYGLIRNASLPVKILGGKLDKKIKIADCAMSKSVAKIIEKNPQEQKTSKPKSSSKTKIAKSSLKNK